MTRPFRGNGQARTRSGMTLVEILAVVVVLGLLAGILIVNFSGSFGRAKHELARTGIGQLAQRLELYRLDSGEWPSSDVGLKILSQGYANPGDPFYVEPDKLLDPWEQPYWLVTPGPGDHPYEIITYGADGIPGGEGENGDITSADLRGLNE